MLTDREFEIYYNTIFKEIKPRLIGASVVSKSEHIKENSSYITVLEKEPVEDDAKVGNDGAPIPRGLGQVKKRSVYIPGHSHGFSIFDRDLKASREGATPLPLQGAIDSAQVVAESVENMIFNGNKEYNIKGIYKDAGNTYTIPTDKEWNKAGADPYNNIVEAVAQLEETNQYEPKFMVLSPKAYRMLSKSNMYGISPLKQIRDEGMFPMGIFKAPRKANEKKDSIIPENAGLIGDFGSNIAERYVQQISNPFTSSVQGSEYTDIYLSEHPRDKDENWHFNVMTYQGLNLHRPKAFVRLENLIKE